MEVHNMKATEFKSWIEAFNRMSRDQRNILRERLHYKNKWLNYKQALLQGLNLRKAAITCGITKNTSFKWRHCFLRAPAIQQPSQMSGIVEVDETYFLESFKEQHHLPIISRKRGGKAAKRGLQHGGSERCAHFCWIRMWCLCTDGALAYKLITQQAGAVHRSVNITPGQRGINSIHHIQNVNAYNSRLKQWIARFHDVATRHLGSYLGWHRMIDCLSQSITPTVYLLSSIGKIRQFQQVIRT